MVRSILPTAALIGAVVTGALGCALPAYADAVDDFAKMSERLTREHYAKQKAQRPPPAPIPAPAPAPKPRVPGEWDI